MKNLAQIFAMLLIACLFLTACGNQNTANNKAVNSAQAGDKAAAQNTLVGCYSIEKDVPAQIRVSQENERFFMQMQEKQGGWDTPELLNNGDISADWSYFSMNALGLNQSDMQMILARPDGVMALGLVKPALVGINPHMDSPFVINIFGAVNTIYQADCGDN